MKKKKEENNLEYRIKRIHSLKFYFKEIESNRLNSMFEKTDALYLNTKTILNIDDKESSISIDINTELLERKSNEILVEHSGRTVYQIKGLKDIYNETDNVYDIPNEFLIQLYSLAYSHTRALLATEVSPTVYKDKYFLPIINPQDFLKNKNS